MPCFENSGAKLYFEETGCGNPLIFLHGAAWDMHQWDEQIRYFSKEYRVIALDARGHGKSSLPPGKVAIQTAIYAAERVECIILIGAICTNRFNNYERIVLPINRFSLRLMPMSWIAWSISAGMGNFNPEAKPYIRRVVGSLNHDAFNRVWKAVTSMESRDGLSKITCPALILIGDHDSMTRRQQQYIHEHIRNSSLVIIENAHHGTNLDNPEQVEKEIEKFLLESV